MLGVDIEHMERVFDEVSSTCTAYCAGGPGPSISNSIPQKPVTKGFLLQPPPSRKSFRGFKKGFFEVVGGLSGSIRKVVPNIFCG